MAFRSVSKIFFKRNFRTSFLPFRTNSLLHPENKRSIHYLLPLPFNIEQDLDPLFKTETLQELYEYQGTLIDDLNKLTGETEFRDDSIFEIIDKTAQAPEHALIFNHASQAWNNDFFFQTLTKKPDDLHGDLHERIKDEFESIDNFREHFKNMALGIFGSGWTWLVETEYHVLRVVNTYNAGTTLDVTRMQGKDPNNHPISFTSPFLSSSSKIDGGINKPSPPPSIKLALQPPHKSRFNPLLCLNVWEHAYIKDFGIKGKESYIDSFWSCVNWEIVQQRIIQRNDFT